MLLYMSTWHSNPSQSKTKYIYVFPLCPGFLVLGKDTILLPLGPETQNYPKCPFPSYLYLLYSICSQVLARGHFYFLVKEFCTPLPLDHWLFSRCAPQSLDPESWLRMLCQLGIPASLILLNSSQPTQVPASLNATMTAHVAFRRPLSIVSCFLPVYVFLSSILFATQA